jgi:2-amino-4-hydroxy-6-hydroxymethyldihydropteridine diphosphokinase
VAALLEGWAAELGLNEAERARWRSAGWLHDALRDAPPESIRDGIADLRLRALPGPLLHGPAAADRMAADGSTDTEVMDAVRYHTIGHAGLGRLGRALIAADYLEPGRSRAAAWRAELRARLPSAFDAVVRDVIGSKLAHALRAGHPLGAGMVALWNRLVDDARAD